MFGGRRGRFMWGWRAVPELEACDDGFTDACGTCNADCSGAGTGATCGDSESVRNWNNVTMALPMRAAVVMLIAQAWALAQLVVMVSNVQN